MFYFVFDNRKNVNFQLDRKSRSLKRKTPVARFRDEREQHLRDTVGCIKHWTTADERCAGGRVMRTSAAVLVVSGAARVRTDGARDYYSLGAQLLH